MGRALTVSEHSMLSALHRVVLPMEETSQRAGGGIVREEVE